MISFTAWVKTEAIEAPVNHAQHNMKISALELYFQEKLKFIYPSEEVKSLFAVILEKVFGLKFMQVRMKSEETLKPEDVQFLHLILNELLSGKPIQYILGEAYFYGHVFKVNEHTLIPRPETEELVDWIIKDIKGDQNNKRLLDIGTGSGCIPISIKKALPSWNISGLDVCPEALLAARGNAIDLKADVKFILADVFTFKSSEKYNVLVSNPPYIRMLERADMHKNVLNFEPHLALFVPDDNALVFYERIVDLANEILHSGGKLFFEINAYLSIETVGMIGSKGFTEIELRKDMQGKDRMIKAIKL